MKKIKQDEQLLQLNEAQLDKFAQQQAINEVITHAIELANSWQHKKHKDYKPFSRRIL
jgi:hypothetical protein